MRFAVHAFIMVWVTASFPSSLQFMASDPGSIFLISSPMQSGLTMEGPFMALNYSDEAICRRMCAATKYCQAYLSFTSTATALPRCHIFQNHNCNASNNATQPPQLVADVEVKDGTLWLKVPGDLTPLPIKECSVAVSTQTGISTGTTLTASVTESTPPPEISTLGSNTNSLASSNADSSSGIPQTSLITASGASNAESTTVGLATSASTGTSIGLVSSASTSTTVQAVTTALPRLPRTCNDYALNGTNDTLWTVRQIWPWTIYNSTFTNFTYAYCKFGYTAIFRNLPYIYTTTGLYANQQMFFPFPSPVSEGYTVDATRTGLKTWASAISQFNFPLLSALIQQSSRILLFDGFVKTAGVFRNCTYSGLDIGPNGTLSVQTYVPNPNTFNGTSVNAPDGLKAPLLGAPIVLNVNDFCSSFWRLPSTSIDACTQTTNLFLMDEFQRFGNFTYRGGTFAFK